MQTDLRDIRMDVTQWANRMRNQQNQRRKGRAKLKVIDNTAAGIDKGVARKLSIVKCSVVSQRCRQAEQCSRRSRWTAAADAACTLAEL